MLSKNGNDEPKLSSQKICKSSTEALQSNVAEKILKLSLEKAGFDTIDITSMLRIFTHIINNNTLDESDISYFQNVLNNKDLETAYNSIIKKIPFENISIEEIAELKNKIDFKRIKLLCNKFILKSQISQIIEKGENPPFSIISQFGGKTLIKIDGTIYQKLGSNIFKNILNEEVKLFIQNNGVLEEIQGIQNSERIVNVIENREGFDDIIWMYEGFPGNSITLYNTKNKKSIIIDSTINENDIQIDNKGRLVFKKYNGFLFIDIINMSIIEKNILSYFEYNGAEYFISHGKNGFLDIRCKHGHTQSIECTLPNLHIDAENGKITYGGIFGTKFMQKTLQLN